MFPWYVVDRSRVTSGSILADEKGSMLDRPPLTEAAIAAALRDRYGIGTTTLEFLALGPRQVRGPLNAA
jgi:hypothetical protein